MWKRLQRLSQIPIVREGLIVVLASVVAKLVVFAKEVCVAAEFGVSSQLDAFLMAFVIVTLPANTLFSTLGTALIPPYLRLAAKSQQSANELVFSVSSIGFALVAGGMLLLSLVLESLLPLLASGFTTEQRELTLLCYYWLLPYLLFMFFAAVLGAILNAHSDNVLYSGYLALPAAGTVFCLLVWPARGTVGDLALGANLGMALAPILMLMRARKHHLRFCPANLSHSFVKSTLRQWVPLILASLLITANLVVDRAMAASLQPGSVSTLDYGIKAAGVFGTLSMTIISTLFFPRFARLVASARYQDLKVGLAHSAIIIFVGSTLAAIMIWFLSEFIVRLLFERKHFTSNNTSEVAVLLQGYVFGLPFQLCGVLGVRCLSALQLNGHIAVISLISMLANILLNLVLMQRLGLSGLAWSTSLVYLCTFILIWLTLRQRFFRDSRYQSNLPEPTS